MSVDVFIPYGMSMFQDDNASLSSIYDRVVFTHGLNITVILYKFAFKMFKTTAHECNYLRFFLCGSGIRLHLKTV